MSAQNPHSNLALEAKYIRSCIRAGRASHLVNAEERLNSSDCESSANADILGALQALADSRSNVDTFTVRQALESLTGAATAIQAYDSLIDGDVSKSVEQMALKLRELARRRRRHTTLLRALAASIEGKDDAVTEFALQVDSDAGETRDANEFMPAHDVVYRSLEFFKSLDVSHARRTGFAIVDDAIGALQPGSMCVVGGYTGVGKSSLILAWALHQARRGTPVCIVSLEDPITTWGPRIAAHFTGINPNSIHAEMGDAVYMRTVAACEQIAQTAGVQMAFEIGRPLTDVLRAIRHNVRKYRCKIVYVDYLQAIGWVPGKDEARRLFISHAASAIKSLCAELGAALVLGSQLTRPERGAEFKEPNVSALKESGDIENMSEIIVLLWKDGDKEESRTLGKIAKVKWSNKRPRFEIVRGADSGSVLEINHASSNNQPPSRGNGAWE